MSISTAACATSAEQEALRSAAGAPLVHRHRPKRFEEVIGQDVPVDYLSGLILRGQACRNILLHGSVGSGKTTLARIYAKALNCESPSLKDGSPCLVGTTTLRLLPGVNSLSRAEELSQGAQPTTEEAPAAALLDRAGRCYDAVAGVTPSLRSASGAKRTSTGSKTGRFGRK